MVKHGYPGKRYVRGHMCSGSEKSWAKLGGLIWRLVWPPGGRTGRDWDGSISVSSSRKVRPGCGDASTQTMHQREMPVVSRMNLPLYTRPVLSSVGSSQKKHSLTMNVEVGLEVRPSGTTHGHQRSCPLMSQHVTHMMQGSWQIKGLERISSAQKHLPLWSGIPLNSNWIIWEQGHSSKTLSGLLSLPLKENSPKALSHLPKILESLLTVMVNFLHHLDCIMGCPCVWLNIVYGCGSTHPILAPWSVG